MNLELTGADPSLLLAAQQMGLLDPTSLPGSSATSMDGLGQTRLMQALANVQERQAAEGGECHPMVSVIQMGISLINEDQVEELVSAIEEITREYRRLGGSITAT